MKAKGFTLIELAVVLAIIAVLAAVLTPVVTNYIDQARVARAMSDAKVVADAIRLYQRDVSEYPIWDTTSEASTDTVGSNGDFIRTANGSNATPGSGDAADWNTNVATTTLESYLNTNTLGRSTSTTGLGRAAFRGPYIGSLESDPWGYKYYLTGLALEDSSTDWAFVVSAGPDGVLDTDPDQARSGSFVCSNDDVCVVVK